MKKYNKKSGVKITMNGRNVEGKLKQENYLHGFYV